jgi:hypothetical protein
VGGYKVAGDADAGAEKGRGVLGRGIEARERAVPCCDPGPDVPRGVIGVDGVGRGVLEDRPGDDIPDDCLTVGISPADPLPFCASVGEGVACLACPGIRNTRPQRGQGPVLASHSLLPQRGHIMLFPSQLISEPTPNALLSRNLK